MGEWGGGAHRKQSDKGQCLCQSARLRPKVLGGRGGWDKQPNKSSRTPGGALKYEKQFQKRGQARGQEGRGSGKLERQGSREAERKGQER